MKKLNILASLLMLSSALFAQVDRSKMPEPGPAPDVEIADYKSFELKNGLKVFIIQNDKVPRVSFNLIVENDPVLEGDKAGYVSIAGELIGEGTTNRDKDSLYSEIEFIGGRLNTSSNSVYVSGLSDHSDKLMELMADVVKNPSFPEDAFNKLKKQSISGLKANKNDPGAISRRVRKALLYGKDHPYGEVETEESLENITLDDCKNYYNTYFKPNVSYLAIVGDIGKWKAKRLVKKHLKDWSKGDVPTHEYETPTPPEKPVVAIVNRESAVQSQLNIGNVIELEPGNEDVLPLKLMNKILGGGSTGRLFKNLREDKAYTYGAYSNFSQDELIGYFNASANVRNEVTDSAITEFMKEFDRIIEKPVNSEELGNAKKYISGSFARSLERPQTVARFAINTSRYKLSDDYYSTYLKRLNASTPDDIQRVAKTYINKDQPTILVVGKAADVAGKLEKFGEIKYFDTDGNEVEAPTLYENPEGLTAKKVLTDYIKSIGGKENIKQIDNLKWVQTASMNGRTIEIANYYAAPNKSKTTVSMMGMNLMDETFDGENMSRKLQGQKQPVSEDDLQDAEINNNLVPEIAYIKNNELKLELLKPQDIDGKMAYQVKVIMPSGKERFYFFDSETGLKVKETGYQKGQDGESVAQSTEYLEYKEVKGVKFPVTVTIPLGPASAEAKTKVIEANIEMDKSMFEVN
jgi:predicted Zn-dependent peptidase